MNFRRSLHIFVAGFLTIALCADSSLFAAARHPSVAAPDATVDPITWNDNGSSTTFDSRIYSGEHYITIEQLSKIANAQMRWQSVSQQACLSRNTGLVCFNWDRNQIYMNGEIVRPNYKVRFEEGQLYIPMLFTTSKAFGAFTGQDFMWNVQAKRLTENAPVTVSIPPIQNLGDRYQLAMDVSGRVPYHMLQNSKDTIWIRFVRGNTEGSQILEGDDVIKEIRVSQKRHSADLIIQLGKSALSHEVYFDQGTNKLTVDVYKDENEKSSFPVASSEPAPAPVSEPAASTQHFPPAPTSNYAPAHKTASLPVPAVPFPPAPVPAVPSRPKPQAIPSSDPQVWTVVIDPGHGGMDPGAIGTRGTFEKDVNLKVAKELAEALEKNKSYRVLLTRDKDEFLTLSERTMIANRVKADVFVSIHCNSSISVKTEGFEVYVLAQEATDQAAASIARMENSVVALEAKKGDHTSKLEELLASMAVSNTVNESSKFAGYVCRAIRKRSGTDKTEVKEANFHVLRGAQMPSVLIELGYLSHPYSELQLRSSRYLDQMSKGIGDGVLMYQQSMGKRKQSLTTRSKKIYQEAQK